MNKITCTVVEPYFSWLLSGEKTVEGRIRKGKWDNLAVGDVLLISKELNGTQVEYEITSLCMFPTFEDLYAIGGTKLLPNEPDKAWDVYSNFFSKEDEEAYGVIGIQLKRKTYL